MDQDLAKEIALTGVEFVSTLGTVLVFAWFIYSLVVSGWFNTVDTVAYYLHRYAVWGRRLHAAQTKMREASWKTGSRRKDKKVTVMEAKRA